MALEIRNFTELMIAINTGKVSKKDILFFLDKDYDKVIAVSKDENDLPIKYETDWQTMIVEMTEYMGFDTESSNGNA